MLLTCFGKAGAIFVAGHTLEREHDSELKVYHQLHKKQKKKGIILNIVPSFYFTVTRHPLLFAKSLELY